MQPCPMCASAIKQSRIKNVYYGIENSNNYISEKIFEENDINASVNVFSFVLGDKCKEIIDNFFENKRKNKK